MIYSRDIAANQEDGNSKQSSHAQYRLEMLAIGKILEKGMAERSRKSDLLTGWYFSMSTMM